IDGKHLLLVDEITPRDRPIAVTWQMHTTAAMVLNGAAAMLSASTKTPWHRSASLDVHLLEPAGAGFTTALARPPPTPTGQDPNDGIAKLLVRLDGVAGPLRLAVLLARDGAD